MLRRSSLVELHVSVLHGTCLQCAEFFFYPSVLLHDVSSHNQNGLPEKNIYCKNLYLVFFYCALIGFFKTCLNCDNYFLDLWINQISTGNEAK